MFACLLSVRVEMDVDLYTSSNELVFFLLMVFFFSLWGDSSRVRSSFRGDARTWAARSDERGQVVPHTC